MKTRPILFSAPMVRALLDGSKTQTRRALRIQPIDVIPMNGDARGINWAGLLSREPEPKGILFRCKFGVPGDLLWVRETHRKIIGQSGGWIETDYRATYKHGERMGDHIGAKAKWTPSIFMPRAASRITLRITEVRCERLNDISNEDAAAEGWPGPDAENTIASAYPIAWYSRLWESINGNGSWELNPWVWAVSFERVKS